MRLSAAWLNAPCITMTGGASCNWAGWWSGRKGRPPCCCPRSTPSSAVSQQEFHEEDWTSLLRVFYALEVYNHAYSVAVLPDRVMDLLVSDPLLPESLGRSVGLIGSEIAAIGSGPYSRSGRALQRLVGPPVLHD